MIEQIFNTSDPNPLDVVQTATSGYAASNNELVITNADSVELPAPQQNGVVAVRDFGQQPKLTTPSGTIQGYTDRYVKAEDTVYLVSDGTDWYTVSDQSYLGDGIPDSGDLYARYDSREINLSDGDTISSWQDLQNSLNLSATGDPVYRSDIGLGIPGVELDGADDKFVTTGPTESQINQVFILARFRSIPNANSVLFDSESGDGQTIYSNDTGTGQVWSLFAGESLTAGSSDTNWHIFNAKFAGSNSYLRIDGAQVVSGNAGSESLNGITLGDFRGQTGNEAAVDIVEVLPYTTDKTSKEDAIESYLDRDTNIL
jgi:hypothetical protein